MTGRRAGAALLVVCLWLSISSIHDEGRAQPGDREAIQLLLERRAGAVIERDEQTFLSTVAPLSEDFVARQRRLFTRMEELPIGSYELTADWSRYGDLVRPSDRDGYPEAEAVSIPVTEERYELEGFDALPAAEDLFYTFVKIDGDWLIGEDADLEDITFFRRAIRGTSTG